MIPVTYFRSSSYSCFDFCETKYLIDYSLSFFSKANLSASKGSVTHKALEILAKKKLCIQQNEDSFTDDELGFFNIDDIEPEKILEQSYKYYEKLDCEFNWQKKDFTDCKRWMKMALNYKDGMFSPLKRDIIMPEQYFDFLIEEPWAVYDYDLPNGERISGYLGIKGTMDLMTKVGEDYEMIDWKTGARRDWVKGVEKTHEKLMEDPQLLLYYYAARRLYPKIKNIYVTIFYMQAGGPYSLCFGEEHIDILKNMLKDRFNQIRNMARPKLIYPNKRCSWCHFSKNSFDGPTEDYSKSICQTIHNDVIQLGLDRVIGKYSKDKTYNTYGSGGGRRAETIKENK